MDFEALNRDELDRNLDRLCYSSASCTIFEVNSSAGVTSPPLRSVKSEKELLLWTRSLSSTGSTVVQRLRLVAYPTCNQTKSSSVLNVPFSDSKSFKQVIDALHLPTALFYHLVHPESQLDAAWYLKDAPDGWSRLLMQLTTKIDGQQDLVLAIAFNEAEHTINALLLGCTKSVLPDPAIAQPAAFDDISVFKRRTLRRGLNSGRYREKQAYLVWGVRPWEHHQVI